MPRPEFDAYQLDLKRYELRRADGMTVKLERQPMELLIFLAERRGELVMRDEIAAKLWTNGVFVDTERGINNAIRKIRTALHDSPDDPTQLQTVVGKGYRFIGQLEVAGGSADLRQDKAPDVSATASKWERWRLVISAGIAVAIVILAVGLALWRSRAAGSQAAIHSLAVLPLANLSGDPSQEYFADGMTEALITELAKISALKVISRTSVMQYKGARRSLPEIARALGVNGIIEGSVLREGDQVKIAAQLIAAPGETRLWAQDYVRDLRNILALQSEVARAIAKEVKTTLTPAEDASIAS